MTRVRRPATASRGYGGKWQTARAAFLATHRFCVMCHPTGAPTTDDIARGHVIEATVVDHIKRHGLRAAQESGDPARIAQAQHLMWSRSNWQPLCETHHNATKQRMESRGYEVGARDDGLPLDPGHHWNR